jgi:hypothetical protein
MEVRLMAERDLQKDLDAVKEDLAKLRSDIAELTQRLIDTGRSEVSTARKGSDPRLGTLGGNFARHSTRLENRA